MNSENLASATNRICVNQFCINGASTSVSSVIVSMHFNKQHEHIHTKPWCAGVDDGDSGMVVKVVMVVVEVVVVVYYFRVFDSRTIKIARPLCT